MQAGYSGSLNLLGVAVQAGYSGSLNLHGVAVQAGYSEFRWRKDLSKQDSFSAKSDCLEVNLYGSEPSYICDPGTSCEFKI